MNEASFSPKVSIIIPVYNGSDYLKEAIDSALAQTYPHIEVLVINDGSDDRGATDEIARSYGSRIRYFSKPNGGVSTALNLGIEKMTGEYFSWLSHDDVYKPEKIEKQIEFLQQGHSPDTILYGGYELITSKSITIDVVDFAKLYPTYQLSVSLFPVFRGLSNGCTMLIHKSHFERVGWFDVRLRTTQDYDLWFRMFREAEVVFCPGIYVKSRVHSTQTGRTDLNHSRECEQLWISMLKEVTDEEMCRMEGTPYHFYIRTAMFLKNFTSYLIAEEYARKLAEEEMQKNGGEVPEVKLHSSVPVSMSTGGLIYKFYRFAYVFKEDGFLTTFKKIIRKLG